jgi:hypothetical protein
MERASLMITSSPPARPAKSLRGAARAVGLRPSPGRSRSSSPPAMREPGQIASWRGVRNGHQFATRAPGQIASSSTGLDYIQARAGLQAGGEGAPVWVQTRIQAGGGGAACARRLMDLRAATRPVYK